MDKSYLLAYLLIALIDEVHLQQRVEGPKGGSVILPCTQANPAIKRENTDIFWRFKDKKNVYSVTSGKASLSQQDLQFQNRAQTFPEEYVNGNFSLKLNNLDLTDAGKYSCYVPDIGPDQHMELHVKDIVIERLPTESSPAEKSDPAGRSDSVKTSPEPALVLFLIFLCSQRRQFV